MAALSPMGTPTDAYFVSDVASVVARLDRPVRLVLDNFERLAAPAAESIALLLQHGLPSLRAIIATRGEPPSPVARLRLAGDVAEIGAGDLAFTASEAAHYWSIRGRDLDDPEDLVRHTEGLAAGVCHDEQALAELFRREVLGPRPTLRQFLLRCSVVDRVCGGLAVAVTGRRDAAGVLNRLCAQGVLQRADGSWYRYSLPLREFLRREADGDRIGPHRRAARWYAGRGEFADAVHHATAAKDWRLAAGSRRRTHRPVTVRPARRCGQGAGTAVARRLRRRRAGGRRDADVAGGRSGFGHRYAPVRRTRPAQPRSAGVGAVRPPASRTAPGRDRSRTGRSARRLRRGRGADEPAVLGALGAVPAADQLHAVADLTIGVHRLWEADFDGAELILQSALAMRATMASSASRRRRVAPSRSSPPPR